MVQLCMLMIWKAKINVKFEVKRLIQKVQMKLLTYNLLAKAKGFEYDEIEPSPLLCLGVRS